MSDKGINLNAAKDTLTKIQAYNDSLSKNFNVFNQILSNANANYSSDNKRIFIDRQNNILSNFSKLQGVNKKYAVVIQKNIIKYTNTEKAIKDILDR